MNEPYLARFLSRFDKGQGCWIWNASVATGGYGQMWTGLRSTLAHRIALAIKLGRPLRSGEYALHSCDNPPCVNPGHLRSGTQEENLREMRGRGRERLARPRSLTDVQVRAVRRLYAAGTVSQKHLAAAFGASPNTVSLVVNRKTYRDVT